MTYGRFEAIRRLTEQCVRAGHELEEFLALVELVEYVDQLTDKHNKLRGDVFRFGAYVNTIHWDDKTPNTAEWLLGLQGHLEHLHRSASPVDRTVDA